METETLDRCNLCGSSQLETLYAASDICRCVTCGYIFDNPRPTASAIKDFYSRPTKYDGWMREEDARDALWKRRLRKLARTKKPGSLLDVGTGIGQFLHHAAADYSPVDGTEVSDRAIEIAKQKYGLAITPGTIETIPFGDVRYDNITLFHVLEHVPNPRAVVDRCRDLLTAGGVLVIAVPNDIDTLRGARRKVRAFLRQITGRAPRPGEGVHLPRITLDGDMGEIHLSHFTTRVLRRLLERSGFVVLQSSIDPFYVARGSAKVKEDLIYIACRALNALVGINVYDTIWIAARRA
jgi:SAM-dependent methyltransferase